VKTFQPSGKVSYMRFLMVDRVRNLEPGKRIVASKRMDPDEELFQDHFPGFPVVPGVLLTEMMAQAGGKCLFAGFPERGFPMLIRIKNASFRSWVRPGQEIQLEVEVKADSSSYATVAGQGQVDGKSVCSAELVYSFVPSKTFGASMDTPELFSTEGQTNGD
jgi:3-hydroxyacyl-[acyl-carrier-protein] dehydratase